MFPPAKGGGGEGRDWGSSEILFLEENAPSLPIPFLYNLAYNKPPIFVAHFKKKKKKLPVQSL